MLFTLVYVAFTFAAMSHSQQMPEDLHFCEEAYKAYHQEQHSNSIQLVNQCITHGALSNEHYAAALYLRSMNYEALGQDDNAEGDLKSALEKHNNAKNLIKDFEQ